MGTSASCAIEICGGQWYPRGEAICTQVGVGVDVDSLGGTKMVDVIVSAARLVMGLNAAYPVINTSCGSLRIWNKSSISTCHLYSSTCGAERVDGRDSGLLQGLH